MAAARLKHTLAQNISFNHYFFLNFFLHLFWWFLTRPGWQGTVISFRPELGKAPVRLSLVFSVCSVVSWTSVSVAATYWGSSPQIGIRSLHHRTHSVLVPSNLRPQQWCTQRHWVSSADAVSWSQSKVKKTIHRRILDIFVECRKDFW